MLGTPVIVTPPAVEPISVDEAKQQLRILRTLTAAETTELEDKIKAARLRVERYLQRALITQTWDVYFDCWSECMEIPYPPLASVSSVKYFDLDGVEQTWNTNQYWVVTDKHPGFIVRRYETTFPELQYGRPSAIVARAVVGYGASGSDVPEDINDGIKTVLTDLWENRGTVVMGSVNKIPGYLTDLIHSYRIYQF
jgi:uncharacterized phiE125 gp8 family phage protein